MAERPFSHERKGLYYTGVVFSVTALFALVLSGLSSTSGRRAEVLIAAVFFFAIGAFLTTLGKPAARTPAYYETQRWAFVIALGFTGLMGLSFGAWNLVEACSSRDWPQSHGVVLSARMVRHSGNGGTSFTANIIYHYEVVGATYTADRISFPNPSFDAPAEAKMVLDRFSVGEKILVFYSPNSPGRAVLEPGIFGGTWFAPGVGVVCSSLSLLLVFIKRRHRHYWSGTIRIPAQ